jgi:signal peptidase I
VSILLFLIVSYLLICATLVKVFDKAGIPAWKAWVPLLNFMEVSEMVGHKRMHALWLLFPVVNLFIYCSLAVDIARSFGRFSFKDAALAVIYSPILFYLIGSDKNAKYNGRVMIQEKAFLEELEEATKKKDSLKLKKLDEKNPYKKSVIREWTESIVFAVFAASFIRMFLLEAFVIPTPSMEGSLNVGDFLFVSKAHYGIRTPMTVASVPLLHNTVPVVGGESYAKKPSLPYYRLPAISSINTGEPFVFNWPVGDSVYVTRLRSYTVSQVNSDPIFIQSDRELAEKVRQKSYVVRPVDKKDHYIKRCVAGPGDTIQIINKQVFINGKAQKNPRHLQYFYTIGLPQGISVSTKKLESWGIDDGDKGGSGPMFFNGIGQLFLDDEQVNKLKSLHPEVRIEPYKSSPNPAAYFPFDASINKTWTTDDYGPVWIPKKGATTPLSLENLAFYRRAISVYENNKLEVKGKDIYINGEKADSYTFKQDYYWAMGDNRHNSEDSRMWGYVPHDHIVGKPLFIFFSTKEGSISNGINWDRVFRSANKD